MAVLQRVALLPNERFDTPDARSLEAFSLNDWRFFLKGFFSEKPLILSGFDISNYDQIFTSPGFQIKVDDAALFLPDTALASAGFYVSSGTEPDINVTLSPNAVNFVELDLTVLSGTPDVRAFFDTSANGGVGAEFTDTVDTVINLELEITANINSFTVGKIPLYKVTTDASNVVTSVTWAQNRFGRLGTGGNNPDPNANYAFPELPDAGHARFETPVTATAFTSTNAPFQGGDKNFRTLKDWMDVVMTLFKETNSVPFWYMKPLAGGIAGAYANAALVILTGGTWQHGSTGLLTLNGGATAIRLGKANNVTVSAFTDLDLNTEPTLYLLFPATDTAVAYGFGQDAATPVIPKAVSAFTSSSITVATGGNYINGGGKILVRGFEFTYTTYTPGTGVFTGVSPDPSGLIQNGDHPYQLDDSGIGYLHQSATDVVPGLTSSGVSEGAERTLWLAHFDGSNKIHLRNGDLEEGEEIQVGDETPLTLLQYIGALSEADSTPDYTAEGSPNRFIADDDSLTTAIAKLDRETDKYFGQLRLTEHSPVNKRVIITGADRLLADNTTLAREIRNLLMDFAGAEIDFDTGTIYETDGTTVRQSFAPGAVGAGEFRWHSINILVDTVGSDNRASIVFDIVPADDIGASAALAPRADFVPGAIKVGQVVIEGNGVDIEDILQEDIIQAGLTSDSEEIVSTVKVDLFDPVSTTLPAGVSATIDGVTVVNGDTVLFANLSSGNNKIYEVSGVGIALAWKELPLFNGLSTPTESDEAIMRFGNDFAQQTATFNGTSWLVKKVVRQFHADKFVEEEYIDPITLTASTTAVASALTFDTQVVKAITIDYTIVEATTFRRRNGRLRVVVNEDTGVTATVNSLNDDFAETADVGVEWSAAFNGQNLELSYTTTANNKTMKAHIKRFR